MTVRGVHQNSPTSTEAEASVIERMDAIISLSRLLISNCGILHIASTPKTPSDWWRWEWNEKQVSATLSFPFSSAQGSVVRITVEVKLEQLSVRSVSNVVCFSCC